MESGLSFVLNPLYRASLKTSENDLLFGGKIPLLERIPQVADLDRPVKEVYQGILGHDLLTDLVAMLGNGLVQSFSDGFESIPNFRFRIGNHHFGVSKFHPGGVVEVLEADHSQRLST